MQLLITGLMQFQSGSFALPAKCVKIKNEQVHFIMYNEEICSYSVRNRWKELLEQFSLLTGTGITLSS